MLKYNEKDYDRTNIILNKIRKIREENNTYWLQIYDEADIMSKFEIAEIKEKRAKNNEKLMNCLKVIFHNDIKDGIELFKKIVDNDDKIHKLCERLVE
jgi:hypothetical protein